jgi:hypothetical protein
LLRHVRDVNAEATAGISKKDLDVTHRVLLQLMENLESIAGAKHALTEVDEP